MTPGIGFPEKVIACDSPTGPLPSAALRFIAAAFAMAEPFALLIGEYVSSDANDPPIYTPLINKSPARIEGMLPETSTDNLKFRRSKSLAVLVASSGEPPKSFN
jgi:hypothetical protein